MGNLMTVAAIDAWIQESRHKVMDRDGTMMD